MLRFLRFVMNSNECKNVRNVFNSTRPIGFLTGNAIKLFHNEMTSSSGKNNTKNNVHCSLSLPLINENHELFHSEALCDIDFFPSRLNYLDESVKARAMIIFIIICPLAFKASFIKPFLYFSCLLHQAFVQFGFSKIKRERWTCVKHPHCERGERDQLERGNNLIKTQPKLCC